MTDLPTLPFVSAAEVQQAVSPLQAIDALEGALRAGGVSDYTPLRTQTNLEHGHLLYMPSQVGDFVGVKLASVAPSNPERGLPRIQGLVVLTDSVTMRPRVILDAAGLTVLRTSALSALAVRHLAAPEASTLVVFGAGPQALGHVEAIRAVRPLRRVIVVGRTPERARDLVEHLTATGLTAELGTPDAISEADIVACSTTATTPLFDSSQLQDSATVVAVGSHSPTAREVDTALVERAFVVVESRASAFVEAGDIILACADGVPPEQAVNAEIADLVHQPVAATEGPRLFKGVGEAWCDTVVATLAAHTLGLTD